MAIGSSIHDVVSQVIAHVGADTDISDFCMTNYGSPPKIYDGYVRDNAPTEEDMPAIQISPADVSAGVTNSEFSWDVGIAFHLSDNSTNVSIANRVIYRGSRRISAFGQLLLVSLQNMIERDVNRIVFSRLDLSFEPSDFPFWSGTITAGITTPNTGFDFSSTINQ